MIPVLKISFSDLCKTYSKNNNIINKIFEDLVLNYTSGRRFYHNLTHISNLLAQTDSLFSKFNVTEYLLFAIWFHDIIYDPLSKNNEEKSADFAHIALKKINYPQSRISKVEHIIKRTKNHYLRKPNESVDLQLMLDLDLMILGSSPRDYEKYTQAIRNEYASIPDNLFNKGRKKVIFNFLTQENIYRTEYFLDRFEIKARKNLNAEFLRYK